MPIYGKIIALLLIAAMLLTLTACGEVPQQEPGTGTPAAETPTQAPAQDTSLPKVQAADLLEGYTARPVEGKDPDETFTAAEWAWSVDLFRQVYGLETQQKTLLVSPLSVVIALAMTANGANGNTLQEMEQVLGSGSLSREDLNAYLNTYLNGLPSSERAKFSFADAIWFRDAEGFEVKEDFLQKNVDYFDAAIRKAPFDETTVREINQWVSQHTDDMIPKLVDALDGEMVLVNALVFDAKWDVPFQEHGTDNLQPFTCLDGTEVRVPMMGGTEYAYLEDDTLTGFMKSYEGDTYRFVALLPKDEEDFDGFVAGLTGERLAELTAGVREEKTLIMLPKFSYDYSTHLPAALNAMGIRDAFDPATADFSGMSNLPLYISDVLHKTHIDLDSEGTRAAAVTAVFMKNAAMPEPVKPHEVFLDRPFVYMIVETATGLPLFIGTVTECGE